MKKYVGPPKPRARRIEGPGSPPPQPVSPEGGKPEPLHHRRYVKIVGIGVGDLVRVRGDRDGKYVVVSAPTSEGRWQGRKLTTLELLGPGGLVTVPLRFCVPYHP